MSNSDSRLVCLGLWIVQLPFERRGVRQARNALPLSQSPQLGEPKLASRLGSCLPAFPSSKIRDSGCIKSGFGPGNAAQPRPTYHSILVAAVSCFRRGEDRFWVNLAETTAVDLESLSGCQNEAVWSSGEALENGASRCCFALCSFVVTGRVPFQPLIPRHSRSQCFPESRAQHGKGKVSNALSEYGCHWALSKFANRPAI